MQLAAAAAWSAPVLVAALRLLQLLPLLAQVAAHQLPGVDAPLPPTEERWCWLAAHVVASSVWGHHLLCHYRLIDNGRRQRVMGTALQSHLLHTALLQVQSSALPVAAHALGLVPTPLAASCTALPLCNTVPQAAAFCSLFLAANAISATVVGRHVARKMKRF